MSRQNRSVFDAIQTMIPSLDDLVGALQTEHDTSERLSKLMLIMLALIRDMAELIENLSVSASDISAAQITQVRNQQAGLDAIGDTFDRNATARTVINNLRVWLQSDPETVAEVLRIADKPVLTDAARLMSETEVLAVMTALQEALQ